MMDEYGAFGGMRIGRGDGSTRRKPLYLSIVVRIDTTFHSVGKFPFHLGTVLSSFILRFI
jgi:hypothetical protein